MSQGHQPKNVGTDRPPIPRDTGSAMRGQRRSTCASCAYFSPARSKLHGPLSPDGTCITVWDTSKCRRRPPSPPQVDANGCQVGGWPQVEADDWCGEYEPNAEARATFTYTRPAPTHIPSAGKTRGEP